MISVSIARGPVRCYAAFMASTAQKVTMERACEREGAGHRGGTRWPDLGLPYKTPHDALGSRTETADITIAKLRR
jgi:hypothetical protein